MGNTLDISRLGTLQRLPYEVRQLIWQHVKNRALLQTCSSLQYDVLSSLKLTFILSGAKAVTCRQGERDRPRACYPTKITIVDQIGHWWPLHPAFFDFRSPDQERLDSFLRFPIHSYRALEILLRAPYPCSEIFCRLYNSLLWLLDLFQVMSSQQLPPITIRFSEQEGYVSWLRHSTVRFIDPHVSEPVFDRADSRDLSRKYELTNMCILLRTLRKLRRVKRLTFCYDAALKHTEEHPALLSAMEEVQSLAISNIPFGTSEFDRRIQAEINHRTAFYEMVMGNRRHFQALRRERHAFWSESYEKAARRRIAGARLADGSVPEWREKAMRRLDEQRLITKMYNPLGRTFLAIHRRGRNFPGGYHAEIRRRAGAGWDDNNVPLAWFVHLKADCFQLPIKLPKTSSGRFREHASRCGRLLDPAGGIPPWLNCRDGVNYLRPFEPLSGVHVTDDKYLEARDLTQ